MIPWRVKNFLSERFPLIYHLAANVGSKRNSPQYWDAQLEKSWDAPIRYWPSKNALIASLVAPTDAVLDIGCGNGGLLRHLRERGGTNLHGLEISRYAIQRLSASGICMHHGMLPEIPLPAATFDVVIASQVLEHIVRRTRFVREVRRVLKPGGRAFVFVPDNCLGPISEKEHVRKYTADTLRAFLSKSLVVVSVESMKDTNHEMPVLFAIAKAG